MRKLLSVICLVTLGLLIPSQISTPVYHAPAARVHAIPVQQKTDIIRPQDFLKNLGTPKPEPKLDSSVPQIRQFVHKVKMHSYIGAGHCTGTAIGPYALLLASHCEEPMDTIGLDEGSDDIHIDKIVRDDHEHSILYLSNMFPFQHWASVDLSHNFLEGEDVVSMGNPANLTFLLRKGYLASASGNDGEGHPWHLYMLPVFSGDSGSGIFDSKGDVIDVISMMVNVGTPANALNVMCAFPMKFTPEQIADARAYKPKVLKKVMPLLHLFDMGVDPDDNDSDQHP
jgi:hypothetical protein